MVYCILYFYSDIKTEKPIYDMNSSNCVRATEWLRTDPRRSAIGVDLDLEALNWCMENNVNKLLEASLVKSSHPENLMENVTIQENEDSAQKIPVENSLGSAASVSGGNLKKDFSFPGRDIVCAFNYNCCCLQKRKELVAYSKHAFDALSRKGYTWEQAEFDAIQRMTRISLHYQLHKPQKKIRNAFSYNWRLWSLPEIRDYLEETGYRAIHFG
ncbi:Xin actin-binding repeat-containing protein 2 [Bienertia sinuspersici]